MEIEGKIKNTVKGIPVIYMILLLLRKTFIKAFFSVENLLHLITSFFTKRDQRLKSSEMLKNRYEGERCFIVATGPSLTLEDLELLKEEITISMNSIVKILDQTSYRPTVYLTQDKFFLSKSKELIMKLDPESVFVGISDMGNRIDKPDEAITFDDIDDCGNINAYNLNLSYNYAQWRYLGPPWKKKFSFDTAKQVYDGGNVTYSAIQFAVYMGCKEVYLLGVDNGVKKGEKLHMTDNDDKTDDTQNMVKDNRFDLFQNEFIYAYQVMKEHGFCLYNATRGGALEGIPRIRIEDVLCRENEKSIMQRRC